MRLEVLAAAPPNQTISARKRKLSPALQLRKTSKRSKVIDNFGTVQVSYLILTGPSHGYGALGLVPDDHIIEVRLA